MYIFCTQYCRQKVAQKKFTGTIRPVTVLWTALTWCNCIYGTGFIFQRCTIRILEDFTGARLPQLHILYHHSINSNNDVGHLCSLHYRLSKDSWSYRTALSRFTIKPFSPEGIWLAENFSQAWTCQSLSRSFFLCQQPGVPALSIHGRLESWWLLGLFLNILINYLLDCTGDILGVVPDAGKHIRITCT